MGVYIPNMEKPKNCSECILADKHLNGLYEAKYYCRLEADSCPLIEIPTPHGRLVDIDKVKDKLRDQIPCCGLDMTYSNSNAFDTMDNAPTILEEEK